MTKYRVLHSKKVLDVYRIERKVWYGWEHVDSFVCWSTDAIDIEKEALDTLEQLEECERRQGMVIEL